MKPDEMWNNGRTYAPTILPEGIYKERSLSGWLKILNIINNRKEIYQYAWRNRAKGKAWGWFRVGIVGCYSGDHQIRCDHYNRLCHKNDICLNYKHDSNPSALLGIRCYLRTSEDGQQYIGRVVKNGNQICYLTLEWESDNG